MNIIIQNEGRLNSNYIKNDIIFISVIMIFAVTMYSRLLTSVGLPSVINFIYYPVIIISCIFLLVYRYGIKEYIYISLMFLLFLSIVLSGMINKSSVINILLEFTIVSHFFLFYFLIQSIWWDQKKMMILENITLVFLFSNIMFVFFQYIFLGYETDDVRGVFIGLGAGSHVAGAICLSSCIYILGSQKIKSKIFKVLYLIATLFVMAFTDNKQSLVVFIISLIILMILNLKELKKILSYLILLISIVSILYTLAKSIFPALLGWAKFDFIELGIEQKMYVFKIFEYNSQDYLNYIFGLGPGHTVGRLGQLLPDYYQSLLQFNVKISPITEQVWQAHEGSWVSNTITGSSMWSLFFSVSGIIGDIGLFGLLIVLSLFLWIFKHHCVNNLSKFILLTVVVHGFVFQWWEEPTYMCFIAILIILINYDYEKFEETIDEH